MLEKLEKIKENNGSELILEESDFQLPHYKYPHLSKIHNWHNKTIRSIKVLPKNNLASIAEDGDFYIWNLKSDWKKKPTPFISLPYSDFFTCLSMDGQEKYLLALSLRGQLYVIDPNKLNIVNHFSLPIKRSCSSVVGLADHVFATAQYDNNILLWDINKGESLKVLTKY